MTADCRSSSDSSSASAIFVRSRINSNSVISASILDGFSDQPTYGRSQSVDSAHAGGSSEFAMAGHLLALVVGEALAQWCGNRVQLGSEAGDSRSGGGIFHLGEQHQSAGALHEHAHGRLV